MIQTYSSTIRRKEMEAVLTCMVDEKIGPGEMSERLIQTVREKTKCDGAVALRSPSVALYYALKALEIPQGSVVMLGALSPSWQIVTVERSGYTAMVLDVEEETGLVPADKVAEGMEKGGKVLVLSETMGILPDISSYISLGVPVIEDISQSAMSHYPEDRTRPKQKKRQTLLPNPFPRKDSRLRSQRAGRPECMVRTPSWEWRTGT